MRRQALIHVPAGKAQTPAPVVFVFHGHGGSMAPASRAFGLHTLWPDAIIVYPQGLPTSGMTDPEGKLPGWQKSPGDYADRDLKFFDAMLARQLPALASRLSKLEISSHLYLTPWILTLFSRSLPLSTACRIWDRVLADGEAELFRAALAILQLLQPVLLLAGFEEAVQLLTNLPMLPADETDALETAPEGGASDTSAPSRALVSLDEGVVAAAAATITTMATGGAARHDQMVEAELLATMTRVQLPQAEFEKLLVRCIVHGGRSEEL